jgi:hypothetical protein
VVLTVRAVDATDAVPPPGAQSPDSRPIGGPSWWREARALAAVAVAAALLALLPVLRNHLFYYWDDSAAAFLPSWYRLGELLRHGQWPMLQPQLWMGGNFAAEAQLGLWSPVVCANAVLVSLLPDLALGAVLLKVEFLVLLALGVYQLAREYGAGRGGAMVVAVALPMSGYTLYFDASTWFAGLMGLAWVTHLWWSARRFARGRLSPLVPVVFGALLMTGGSPYGTLGGVLVFVAVLAELVVTRAWRRIGPVLAVAFAVGLTAAPVLLPLLGTTSVTWRSDAGVANLGSFLVPKPSDLMMLSAPTYGPQMVNWRLGYMSFPIMYLAWFAVPLLPWLRLDVIRRDARRLIGLAVFAGAYLLMSVGPSNLWLFRWPVRLVEYLYLPVCVVLAILLSAGLRMDRFRARLAASVALIAVPGYLSWAGHPEQLRHLVATAGLLGLLVVTVWVARTRPRLLPASLVASTGLVLAAQLSVYSGNLNVTPWYAPHDVAAMRANASRYVGNTMQLWDEKSIQGAAIVDKAWRDVLPGSLPAVAGFDSVNSYTGLGFRDFSDVTCMTYFGGVCPELYDRLWRAEPQTGVPLADLLRLETVVVVSRLLPDGRVLDEPPPGWRVADRTEYVTVLRRTAAVPWPAGRVAASAPGLTVLDDRLGPGPGEQVRYSGSGRLVIAALAWPGWQASVDGRDVPVQRGPAGLIALDLPPSSNARTVDLRFTPPGFTLGTVLLAVGLGIGLGYSGWHAWDRRKRRRLTRAGLLASRSPRRSAAGGQ